MPTYAQGTTVSTTASRVEIEDMLKKWGAKNVLAISWKGMAAVIFDYQDRKVRFTAPIPTEVFTPTGRRPRHFDKALEQAERETWRLLLLKIKGKIASVGKNVDEFEIEFQPYIVMPDGRTIGEIIQPQIEIAYREGKMLLGLPVPHSPS